MTRPDMDPFAQEIFNLGVAITRCRDLDRAMPEFVRAWADEQDSLPDPVIPPAEPFEVDAMGGVR